MSCTGWTYSQLDRILRPLRNRCNALATFSTRSQALVSADNLSLAILPPPDSVGFRIHLDRQHVKTLELSRRLYAVRDCFRTFLGKVLANNAPQCVPERVITLSDVCAMIVGGALDTDHASELFEAIPSQYQRKAIVAHSLDLVLQLCPYHHTLILLLLEVTLAFGLANESNTLLHAILTAVCCPDGTSTKPPLCHPAHQTFLVDFCNRWTSSGQTIAAFVRILLNTIRAADLALLWSCEAMKTFFLTLAQDDVATYMSSMHLLLQTLSDADPPSIGQELCSCLQLWLSSACTILLTHRDDHGVDYVPVLLHHIGLLLESWSQSKSSDDTVLEEIQNITICLATHWLYRNRQVESAPYQLRRIEHILSAQAPLPTTFNALVAPIIAFGDLEFMKDMIQEHARTLRSHSWLQYEASLWACTLRQIESQKIEQMLSCSVGAEAVRRFRFKLIDQVEDAEKRCFGNRPSGRKRSPEDEDEDDDEWDWDPTFGCFSSKPERKKPRPDRYSTTKLRRFRKNSTVPYSFPVSSESDEEQGSDGLSEFSSPSLEEEFAMLVSRAASQRVVLHREEATRAVITVDPDSDDILCSFYHDHD